jgi:O-antigen ligase
MTNKYFLVLMPVFLVLVAFLVTGSTALAGVYVGCLMLGLFFALCDRVIHARTRSVTAVELCWVLYLASLLIGILANSAAREQYETAGAMRLWVGLLAPAALMYALPAMITRQDSLRACIGTLDTIGLLISGSVFLSLLIPGFGENYLGASGISRTFGPIGDSVAYATSLFACRALVARKWTAFGFHMAALLLTASVAASLTLVVAAMAHVVLPWQNIARRAGGLRRIAVFAFAMVLVSGVIGVFGQSLILRLTSPALIDAKVVHRVATFQLALEIIREHPVTGVGLRGFSDAAAALVPDSLSSGLYTTDQISTTQNQLLQTLCDAGALGLASLGLLILAALALLNRGANSPGPAAEAFRGYQVWLIGMVIANQSGVWLISFSIILLLLFTVLGLALADQWLRGAALRAAAPALKTGAPSTLL